MKKIFLYSLSALLLLASCQRELPVVTDTGLNGPNPDGSYSIEVTTEEPEFIGEYFSGAGITKASEGTFDIDETYKTVHNVFVVMCKDGKIINSWYATDPKQIHIQFPDNTSAVNLYLLANVGNLRLRQDINIANGQPESAIRGYRYSISGYDQFETDGLPFSNYFEGVTPATLTTLKLKYLVAFYKFHYQAGTNVNKAEITDLSIIKSALDVTVFEQGSKPQITDDLGYNLSPEKISALNRGEYVLVYFLENMQGTLRPGNTNPEAKTKNLPKEQLDHCSYLTIDSKVDDVYKHNTVYLGNDNCSNFDLKRNYGYNLTYTDNADKPTVGYMEIEFNANGELAEANTSENAEYDMSHFRTQDIFAEFSDFDSIYKNYVPEVRFLFSGDYAKYNDIPFTINYHLGLPTKEDDEWKIDPKTIIKKTSKTTMSSLGISDNSSYSYTENIGGYYFIYDSYYDEDMPSIYQKIKGYSDLTDFAIGIEVVFDNGEIFWVDFSQQGKLSSYASALTNEYPCFFADFKHNYYKSWTSKTEYPGWDITTVKNTDMIDCTMMLRDIKYPGYKYDICFHCVDSDFLKVLPITFTDNLGNSFTIPEDFSIGVSAWNVLYSLDPHHTAADTISDKFRIQETNYGGYVIGPSGKSDFEDEFYVVPQTGSTGFEDAPWTANFGEHKVLINVEENMNEAEYKGTRTENWKLFYLNK